MNKKFLSAILFGALAVASTGSFVSCKDYDDDINNLQSQITNMSSLKADAAALTSAIDAAKAALQSDIKSAAQQAVADAKAQALEEAKKEIAKIQPGASMEEVQTAIANAIAKIEACSCDVDGKIAAAVANLVKDADMKDAIAAAVQQIKTEMAALYLQQDALEKYAKSEDVSAEIAAKVAAAQTAVMSAIEAAQAALNTSVEKATAEAVAKAKEAAAAAVAKVDASLNLLAPVRLTSLVFAPETYIDGIETIEFKTFKYADWGTAANNWLRDAAGAYKVDANNAKIEVAKETPGAILDGGKYYAPVVNNIIGDNSTTVQYLVSPAVGVKTEGIKELSYIANQATNSTRAISEAPIKVVSFEVDGGVLTAKLAKKSSQGTLGNGYEEYNASPDNQFTIVSLKATLPETVLNEAEKEAKAEIAVFSDWTRLTESTITPYIANNTKRDSDGKLDCGWWESHFWAFTNIYQSSLAVDDNGNSVTLENYNKKSPLAWTYQWNNNSYIAKTQLYKEDLDLLDLVTVCAGNGKYNYNEIKNYQDYGLEYKFAIMPFNQLNQNSTKDFTPQEKFATLKDGHILVATSRDGQEHNADAVGRTPVIQAVLWDKNNNAVVDVRYFKVQWSAANPMSVIAAKADKLASAPFACAGMYETYILEEYMNNMYANIVEGGVEKTAFHNNHWIYSVWTDVKPMNYAESGSFYALTYTDNKGAKDEKTVTYTIEEIKALLESNDYNSVLEKLAMGQAEDIYDNWYQNQTHNIKISVHPNDYRLPQTEQDFTIDGFFFFQDNSGTSRVIVPVTFDVKKGTLVNKYSYLETQWQGAPLNENNADKIRPANPTLISDKVLGGTYKGTTYNSKKTTQLICDITYGYMANKQTPADFHSLVAYKSATSTETDPFKMPAAESDVVFDADRLDILPAIVEGKDIKNVKDQTYKWATDGKVLYVARFDKDGKEVAGSAVVAAKIDATGTADKRVYLCDTKTKLDDTYGDDKATSIPTEAALLLVGQKVPVKVTAKNCNKVDFDKYLIWFIDPLMWTEGSQAITLKDVLNEGDAKEITLGGQFTLKENFGSHTPLYLFADGTHPVTTELNNWYGIENVAMSPKAEWLINLNANGAIDANSNENLVKFVKGGTTDLIYDLDLLDADKKVTTDISKVKYVKFHNNSGQAITKNLVIKVPVSLDTKWKKGNKNYITVTITPNI